MEVFSPIGAHSTITSTTNRLAAESSPAEVFSLKSSAFRPSSLRNAVTIDDKPTSSSIASSIPSTKKTFPLMERLQSAIKTLEEREERPSLSGVARALDDIDSSRPAIRENITDQITELDLKHISTPKPSSFTQPTKQLISFQEPQVDYGKIEKMIEMSSRRLQDQLQSEFHNLHMDMLKQCLAVQKHQEQMLHMYLPQVKELVEELRVLREENARLRARLQYQ